MPPGCQLPDRRQLRHPRHGPRLRPLRRPELCAEPRAERTAPFVPASGTLSGLRADLTAYCLGCALFVYRAVIGYPGKCASAGRLQTAAAYAAAAAAKIAASICDAGGLSCGFCYHAVMVQGAYSGRWVEIFAYRRGRALTVDPAVIGYPGLCVYASRLLTTSGFLLDFMDLLLLWRTQLGAPCSVPHLPPYACPCGRPPRRPADQVRAPHVLVRPLRPL